MSYAIESNVGEASVTWIDDWSGLVACAVCAGVEEAHLALIWPSGGYCSCDGVWKLRS